MVDKLTAGNLARHGSAGLLRPLTTSTCLKSCMSKNCTTLECVLRFSAPRCHAKSAQKPPAGAADRLRARSANAAGARAAVRLRMQLHKRDRGPLAQRLRRLVLDVRVQSLGLTETAPLKRAHDQVDDRNSLNWMRPAWRRRAGKDPRLVQGRDQNKLIRDIFVTARPEHWQLYDTTHLITGSRSTQAVLVLRVPRGMRHAH